MCDYYYYLFIWLTALIKTNYIKQYSSFRGEKRQNILLRLCTFPSSLKHNTMQGIVQNTSKTPVKKKKINVENSWY